MHPSLELKGLGGGYGRMSPGTNSKRENSSYEFDKLAGFGIKKTLAYSAVDALQLWVSGVFFSAMMCHFCTIQMLVFVQLSSYPLAAES